MDSDNFLLNHLKIAAEIEMGEYYYPFEFVLPLHLPPSFKHSMGKTEYSVRSTLDLPWLVFKVFKNLVNIFKCLCH